MLYFTYLLFQRVLEYNYSQLTDSKAIKNLPETSCDTTTSQVVETSVTVTKSSFQDYTHPDDHTRQTTVTPGFKPFTTLLKLF